VKVKIKMNSEEEIEKTALQLSIEHGGAWIIHVLPFSVPGDEIEFIQYNNPSGVPDCFHDGTGNRIAYKGSFTSFTKSAIIREQNRGIGNR